MTRTLRRILLATGLLLVAAPSLADHLVMEVVPLGYRTLEEVLPVLRPLVPSPGTITGMQNQLVVRTTPENLRSLKQVLSKLDQPPRRLLITVRTGTARSLEGSGAGLGGTLRSGDVSISRPSPAFTSPGLVVSGENGQGARAGARIYSNRSRDTVTGIQQVQVLEGREAFIAAGQAIPFAERNVIVNGAGAGVYDTIRYRNVGSGFYVVPRLNGDRVTLEIHPHSSRFSPRGGGIVDTQEARTTVSGRLGEWLEIGGTREQLSRDGRGLVYSNRVQSDLDGSIQLMVEEFR